MLATKQRYASPFVIKFYQTQQKIFQLKLFLQSRAWHSTVTLIVDLLLY